MCAREQLSRKVRDVYSDPPLDPSTAIRNTSQPSEPSEHCGKPFQTLARKEEGFERIGFLVSSEYV